MIYNNIDDNKKNDKKKQAHSMFYAMLVAKSKVFELQVYMKYMEFKFDRYLCRL